MEDDDGAWDRIQLHDRPAESAVHIVGQGLLQRAQTRRRLEFKQVGIHMLPHLAPSAPLPPLVEGDAVEPALQQHVTPAVTVDTGIGLKKDPAGHLLGQIAVTCAIEEKAEYLIVVLVVEVEETV